MYVLFFLSLWFKFLLHKKNFRTKSGYRNLLIRVTAVEVCDARDDDNSTTARYKKNILQKGKLL